MASTVFRGFSEPSSENKKIRWKIFWSGLRSEEAMEHEGDSYCSLWL